MRGPRSLRDRLALAAVLVTAVSLAVLALVFNVVLSRQLRSGADDLLRSRAAAAAGTVQVAPDGTLSVREDGDAGPAARTTWIYQGRRAVARAPGDAEQQRDADALAGVGERVRQSREPEAVRYLALPLRRGGRQVGTVVSSIGLDPYERVADVALVASVALACLGLAAAYLLARVLVGRVLTPVTRMTEQAAQWSASDLGRRFGSGDRPRELATLAATLDGVLDRLAAVLRHEQQLSAELSHELRTPLAAVVAEVELLDSRPRSPQELAAGHAAVLAAAERMSGVLESLLVAARATTGAGTGRCEVLPVVRRAVESLPPPASDLTVAVHGPAAPLYAGVDAAVLERALAPVLDNAMRHARSQVAVTVRAGATGPEVEVLDDGAGVPPELGEAAFEPGVQGPDRDGGAGLGLALARRLARAGGGDLLLAPGTPGGRFVLVLPPG